MARKFLAFMMVLLGVSASAAFLYYAPASVTLRIIDPPPELYSASIQSIRVTFTKIEIHAADAAGDSGWHELSSSSTIDLLTVLDVSKIVDTAQLPAGKYSEIRFFATEAIIKIDGTDQTYTVPSGTQAGIIVPITGGGFRIYGGEVVTVMLDLSFRNSEILNNPTMTLTPVATASVA